jgi:hypothetical protein
MIIQSEGNSVAFAERGASKANPEMISQLCGILRPVYEWKGEVYELTLGAEGQHYARNVAQPDIPIYYFEACRLAQNLKKTDVSVEVCFSTASPLSATQRYIITSLCEKVDPEQLRGFQAFGIGTFTKDIKVELNGTIVYQKPVSLYVNDAFRPHQNSQVETRAPKQVNILYDIQHYEGIDLAIKMANRVSQRMGIRVNLEIFYGRSVEDSLKKKDYDIALIHCGSNYEGACRIADRCGSQALLVAESTLYPAYEEEILKHFDRYIPTLLGVWSARDTEGENLERLLRDTKIVTQTK